MILERTEDQQSGMKLFDFVQDLEDELTGRLSNLQRLRNVHDGLLQVYPNWYQLLFAVQAFKQLKAVNLANKSVADLTRFLTTRDSLDEVDSSFLAWSETGLKQQFPIHEEEN